MKTIRKAIADAGKNLEKEQVTQVQAKVKAFFEANPTATVMVEQLDLDGNLRVSCIISHSYHSFLTNIRTFYR